MIHGEIIYYILCADRDSGEVCKCKYSDVVEFSTLLKPLRIDTMISNIFQKYLDRY
jgi:hypothetical protein